jgi:uncharacterized protein
MDLSRGAGYGRRMWKALGWICVGLGVIGLALPVVPTVPFLLLAAFCFERGSPELHRWLLEHPTFGPPLKLWRDHRVIRPKSKLIATACISASVIYVIFFRPIWLPVKIAMAIVCGAAILFILTRKNRP